MDGGCGGDGLSWDPEDHIKFYGALYPLYLVSIWIQGCDHWATSLQDPGIEMNQQTLTSTPMYKYPKVLGGIDKVCLQQCIDYLATLC